MNLEPSWLQTVLALLALLAAALVLQWLARLLLQRTLARLGAGSDAILPAVLLHPKVLDRAAQVVPVLVVQTGIDWVPHLPDVALGVIHNLASALVVLCVARMLFCMLDVFLELDARQAVDSGHPRTRSIKAYVQLGQILVALATVVIMIAALVDKSPLIVLSGFGAMSAVLMLVFQDTIKSFVAGLQIEKNDMLRIGDWVEVSSAGADGEVIDVALNTVRVQNFDKSIVTVPTWKLMSESFRNWRGMQQSGGRRIKRPLLIDAGTIGFLSEEQIASLERIALISDYMQDKTRALQDSRAASEQALGSERAQLPANQRRLTNIGTFRAYVMAYLQAHPGIHQGMTLMVRQLQPTGAGVPLELYCFTATTNWGEYEGIQSDIFDHLLAILPEFGLRAFQQPTDAGIRQLGQAIPAALEREAG